MINNSQGEKVFKSVFIVFYKGDRLRNIINKVHRLISNGNQTLNFSR